MGDRSHGWSSGVGDAVADAGVFLVEQGGVARTALGLATRLRSSEGDFEARGASAGEGEMDEGDDDGREEFVLVVTEEEEEEEVVFVKVETEEVQVVNDEVGVGVGDEDDVCPE